MGAERRVFPRWKLEDSVYCYVEGDRLDAQSSDISSGGMFFRTRKVILPGKEVALVFRRQLGSGERPIFLVGRVMRRQVKPEPGVGLRWERAATPADPETLRRFLRDFLQVEAGRIEQKPCGDAGVVQSVFDFPGIQPRQDAAATASEWEDTQPEPSAYEEDDTDETLAGEEHTPEPRPASLGPLTQQLAALGTHAPVDLEASARLGARSFDARVSSLGMTHLFLATRNHDAKDGDRIEVSFKVATRAGLAEIKCDCLVVAHGQDPRSGAKGLALHIVELDEGRERGLFGNYVRWLHFHALRAG